MPGAPTSRYYFGDFRLWKAGDTHVEEPQRAVALEYQGVDQERALIVPSSPNLSLPLRVLCLGEPNPVAANRRGWKALVAALRRGLEARSERADPVVWVEDDSRSKLVTGYAAPTVTSAAHGFSNGDVVLVRRAGPGLWSLATVGAAAANTFTVTAVAGGQLHAIQAGDEIHLVEAYYLQNVYLGLEPVVPGAEGDDWLAERVTYLFKSSGRYTYNRTAATVGS